jgi:anti-sigma factor ChrR (cupin superfamily)
MSKEPSTQHFFARDREWKEAHDGALYVPFATSSDNLSAPLVILSKLPANHREPAHTHGCNYIEILLEGGMQVGKVGFTKGDVRVMQAGAGYGPLVAGPDGCLRLTIFDRADGSMMTLLGSEELRELR